MRGTMKKPFSALVCFLFVLYSGSSCLALKVDRVTPILSAPTSTAETAKEWARSRNATDVFISLADIYWQQAPQIGINPVVAYCQSALETGYGKFGGVINESYCNPCGMKISSGGGDYDPNAHARFDNWECGISAHLDHLALYAKAPGYPKSETYDTRHFAFIWNRGKNQIEKTDDSVGLSGWASSPDYCDRLVSLIESLECFKEPEPSIPKLVLGDANLDKSVTVYDAFIILQASVNFVDLTGDALVCADANADGRVSPADALIALNIAIAEK